MKIRIPVLCVLLFFWACQGAGQTIYVSPEGKDSWGGTERRPVATLARAQELARAFPSDADVEVILADGVYYLPEPLRFTSRDSKECPARVTYRAAHPGRAVVSGGQRLELSWARGRGGVWSAPLDETACLDQLYIDGRRQRMARFPNAEPGKGRNVYDVWSLRHDVACDPASDPLDSTRVARWSDPTGGFVHAMHSALWGDMHWRIQGKAGADSLRLEGGWQNNRPAPIHPVFRMVENIKEELDAPGEWFFDGKERRLYCIPESGQDMRRAVVEAVRLKHLVEFRGSKEAPVRGVCLDGLVFRHARRTFMENREPLLRSDWTVYRGGAVVYDGAEDCELARCEFDQVGGNAIFVNNYNRRIHISGCHIHHCGASGVVFVGDPQAVRSPLFRYGAQDYARMDTLPGPKTDNYPMECSVVDCLFQWTGRDEKQTAAVQISMSRRIRVAYCTVHDVPRAGININEGTFGGHVVEHCDVFNTVLETGDHGSFNSWGRDRFWTPDVQEMSRYVARCPDMTRWDMLEPNVIRDSRWRCDHGWDIDLDDGSSHYRIYGNVLLNGGLKLREGYDRVVTNNIILNNSLHPHVWPRQNGDVFTHNIVFGAYRPAVMQSDLAPDGKWGERIDENFFACSRQEMERYFVNGADWHSRCGDPQFRDMAAGDYRLRPGSPALGVGFRSFPTNDFGVRSNRLQRLAGKPVLPELRMNLSESSESVAGFDWMGATLSEARGNRLSAFGVGFDKEGLAVERVEVQSPAAHWGLRVGDLLQSLGGMRILGRMDLERRVRQLSGTDGEVELSLVRNQSPLILRVPAEALSVPSAVDLGE